MPERLVDSADVVGGLSPEVAARLGLPPGTPMVAVGVDTAMATFAAGVSLPDRYVAMLGTSMCWGFVAPSTEAAHGLISMPYVVGRELYVFGGAATAGASVTLVHRAVLPGGDGAGSRHRP